jgi:hypothetical protein
LRGVVFGAKKRPDFFINKADAKNHRKTKGKNQQNKCMKITVNKYI